KSIAGGACCYLPKEQMIDIAEHLRDVLKAKAENSGTSHVWFDKLAPCFERRWGSDWKAERMDTLRQLNLVHARDELEKIL
ncbi:MAG: hypothetical protein KFF68_05880, partial [Desulfosarcina sp.]|nr:hypothetical protein [Desulfosarcina sp.]